MSKPDSSLQTIAAQVLKTSKIDEQAAAKLLLLGMMNKSLRLPYAVVKPRQQEVAKDKRDGKELTKIVPVEARGIKRKAEDADVSDEGDKKEKRRKMNRVSAQNSRDRKKQYVTDLEKRLKYLEDKNKELAQENKLLQERSCVLEEEKRELASRLANCGKEQAPPQRIEGVLEWSGSAVPTVSLQQKPTSATLLNLWMSVSLISWLACVKDWQHQNLPLHPLPLSLACQPLHRHSIHQEQHLHRVSTWWGAQQTSWNPPMN